MNKVVILMTLSQIAILLNASKRPIELWNQTITEIDKENFSLKEGDMIIPKVFFSIQVIYYQNQFTNDPRLFQISNNQKVLD